MRKRRTALFLSVILAIALAASYVPARDHAEAAAVLLRISEPDSHSAFVHWREHQVRESPADFEGIHARLYTPAGVSSPPGMVIVHGVHHLGIEEPRLRAFSRALASDGIEVLTPELPGIADYHVSPESIDVIGRAAHQLRELQGGRKAGVLGLSFSGGLALMAAADPRYAVDIGYVAAVGAHDDMQRVARFYVNDQAPKPDGSVLHMQAHEYGALVIVYSHVEHFFPPKDVTVAREALRLLLYEQVDDAERTAKRLSAAGQQRMSRIFAHDRSSLRDELMAEIDRDSAEFAAVSPRGHLSKIQVPIFLLHGAGDSVIPPSETEWLASEIPPARLRAKLVSRALSHVDLDEAPAWREEAALVHWLEELLAEARSNQ